MRHFVISITAIILTSLGLFGCSALDRPSKNIVQKVNPSAREGVEGLTSPDPVRRAFYAVSLEMMFDYKPEPAVPFLIDLLDDDVLVMLPDDGERSPRDYAIGTLASIGQPAFPPLVNALRDSRWKIRSGAVEALGKMNDPRTVTPLISSMKDTRWEVRYKAVEALAWKKGPRALETLIAAARDKNRYVTLKAIEGLKNREDFLNPAPLIAELNNPDWAVRVEAVRALADLYQKTMFHLLRRV